MVGDGWHTLADIVVTNPLRQDIIKTTASNNGKAAESQAAMIKEAKYASWAPSDTFLKSWTPYCPKASLCYD